MSVSSQKKFKIIYDGQCSFCLRRISQLKRMDVFSRCEYIDYHAVLRVQDLHPSLDQEAAASQWHLITPQGRIYGGFLAFRQMCWIMPLLYPFLLIVYLPFADRIGTAIYRWIAKNRYRLLKQNSCKHNNCKL